jgi:Kef-type K+ transport system membrane component KefB
MRRSLTARERVVVNGDWEAIELGKRWLPVVYVVMLLGAIAAFVLIDTVGRSLPAPASEPSPGSQPKAPLQSDVLFHVLLALTTVVVAGRALGACFRYIHQPPVIGEVVAGILLGPSLLGRISPEVAGFLLPTTAAPYLGILAQVGVIFYMFLVGLELNASVLHERAHATVATSHASIVCPFVLGAALALIVYPRYSTSDVPFRSFALFMGVAMSVTAFPVLARILTDRRMQKTPMGVVALACAATGDLTAWCLLALVVGVAQSKLGGAVLILLLAFGYVALMFAVVRPLVERFLASRPDGPTSRGTATIVLIAMLASALVTEMIGIHAIFGAFALGAVIPHDSRVARDMAERIEELVTVLLLPAFFAYTGMRTQLALVAGFEDWLMCGLIILTATAGKFGGSCLAARGTGLSWRDSVALGILMNTRGLMELIVLNIGLDLGVLSPSLFVMMVIMALATTMLTTPVLQALRLGGTEA